MVAENLCRGGLVPAHFRRGYTEGGHKTRPYRSSWYDSGISGIFETASLLRPLRAGQGPYNSFGSSSFRYAVHT